MPLNLASPGIVVREVDLTVGRVDPTSASIGAIVAPFAQGPVSLPTVVQSESDLLGIFGQPYSTDKHYEHWMVASSYLAYGASLNVVRADDTSLKNACAGASNDIKIKSDEHYNQLGYDENTITGYTVVAKNPGSWANGIKVALVDAKVDQTLGINTTGLAVGYGVTQAITSTLPGTGTTSVLGGELKGVITEIGTGTIGVKVLSYIPTGGTATNVDYQPSGVYLFGTTGDLTATNNSNVGVSTTAVTTAADWFSNQSITLSNSTIAWNTLADRPSTSNYTSTRGGRFDEVHVVVIDDAGTVTGNAGTILEKHLGLSKAKDAEFSLGSPSYWRKYLASNSEYIFGGSAPVGIVTTGLAADGYSQASGTSWDQNAANVTFAATGSTVLTLADGKNYDGTNDITATGALTPGLDDIVSGYTLFENTENYNVDFLLMGSANYEKETAQALANKVIAVAEVRKDALAFISPYRKAFLNDTSVGTVTVNSDEDITDNVISFYAPVTSSTYAVLDSGYKYMYDRFSDVFRYVPLNGDIAGTCARNDINQFPWFSPAGTQRGSILNAVKLAYNPSKTQRDRLYSNESTQLSSHLVTVSSSSVTRLVLLSPLHSTESTSVASSSTLKMLSPLLLRINCLSSTTRSQEPTSSTSLNHSSATFSLREASSIMLLFVMRPITLLLLLITMNLLLTSSSNQLEVSTSLV